ncbi:hypothetical protein AC578_10172 [Pseudocercospora eumusae]|uniref:Heterokaryon incompatibility domain-containing protein n=1 Tax=Pseudocercospora eumusae TaxID=321146 RepID=A0A139HYX4_9PEZI|nr:hypothetical protein AC578_10172 [Pseudocercospora eumusae]
MSFLASSSPSYCLPLFRIPLAATCGEISAMTFVTYPRSSTHEPTHCLRQPNQAHDRRQKAPLTIPSLSSAARCMIVETAEAGKCQVDPALRIKRRLRRCIIKSEMAQLVNADHTTEMSAATTTTSAPSSRVEDTDDISKRKIPNDYHLYKGISIEKGQEQIRLLQILPANTEDDDEDIVCALFDLPPNWAEGVVYTALSYYWGDMGEQRQISVIHSYEDLDEKAKANLKDQTPENEQDLPGKTTLLMANTDNKQRFNVTVTLYEALKSLRKAAPRIREETPILDFQPIWVDAVCINQGNVEERNSQVSMMGRIYSKAWYVWIWLGESDEVKEGLNLIQQMIRCAGERWGKDFDHLNPTDDQIKGLFGTPYKLFDEILGPEGCYRILDKLFDHPYFRRVWVLQEATVAAERTFVHTTVTQVPWRWLVVANRFRQIWRKLMPTGMKESLPIAWGSLVHERLLRAKRISSGGKSLLRYHDDPGFQWKLYWLFINTYEEFDATDIRDKIFALLDLSLEAAGPRKMEMPGLAPNYRKENTPSLVFRNFTRWCISNTGHLEILSLLCGGPRRVLPTNVTVSKVYNGKVPDHYLDARFHPSWAIWPAKPGPFPVSSLARVQNHRGDKYDLASKHPAAMLDVSSHPLYNIPNDIAGRLIALGGQLIGTVKSNFQMPIRVYSRETPSVVRRQWASEQLEQDMSKYERDFEVVLTDPYIEGRKIKGGLLPLWCHIQWPWVHVVRVEDQAVPVRPQEWLGREGGRYAGKEELMFRDFLETLLLSPVYRGSVSFDDDGGDGEIPHGPWDDAQLATSFALAWAESGDPRLEYMPPRVAEYLRSIMFETVVPRERMFQYLFLGHGKSFFITEDEHMGLCSQDVEPGDIVVALPGSAVPCILHPLDRESDLEGESWSFEGDEAFRKHLFRFMGDCYLHERMTSKFMDEESERLGPHEVFMIC